MDAQYIIQIILYSMTLFSVFIIWIVPSNKLEDIRKVIN